MVPLVNSILYNCERNLHWVPDTQASEGGAGWGSNQLLCVCVWGVGYALPEFVLDVKQA